MRFENCTTHNQNNFFDVAADEKASHYILAKRVKLTSVINNTIKNDEAYMERINSNSDSKKLYAMYNKKEELVTIPESIAFARYLMNVANGGTQKYGNFDYSNEEFWKGHELTGIIGEFVFYFWANQHKAILSTEDLKFVALDRNIKGVNDAGDFKILFGEEQNKIIDVKTSKSQRPYMSCNVKSRYRDSMTAPKLNTGIDYYVGVQDLGEDKYWIVGYTTERDFFKQRNWGVNMSPKSRCFQIHYDDLSDAAEILK